MSRWVKVCGVANEDDAVSISAEGPDAMGFILWAGSPRAAIAEEVGTWTTAEGILRVGVFVDASRDEMKSAVEAARLDVLQLNGSWDSIADAEGLGCQIWKAVHLDKPRPENWESYPVDAYLIDGYSSAMPGGTGKIVDWAMAAKFVEDSSRRVILAGGLHGGNVQAAVEKVSPFGVDASSKLELRPGKKDMTKVREFIAACRAL